MRGSPRRVSRIHSIVCPACELGELRSYGPDPSRCDSCGSVPDGAILKSLRRIAALPDAIGAHACECGHPEMRLLPDRVYRCPACGSEVLPLMAHNGRLAEWEDARPPPGQSRRPGRPSEERRAIPEGLVNGENPAEQRPGRR